MLGVDWVAVVLLGVAFLVSQIRAVPLALRYWVFAAACFGVAGYRLYLGARGINLLFVGLAVVFGLQYAVRALRLPRGR